LKAFGTILENFNQL